MPGPVAAEIVEAAQGALAVAGDVHGNSAWQAVVVYLLIYGAMNIGAFLAPLAVAKLSPLLSPGSRLEFLGLSYVTFRSLDVVFGIHDGVILRLPAAEYFATKMSVPPALVSGPVPKSTVR